MDAGVDAFQGEVGTSEEEREQIGQTVALLDTASINLDPHPLASQGFWRVSTTFAEGCRHNAVYLTVFDTLLKFKPFSDFEVKSCLSCFNLLKQPDSFGAWNDT